MTTIGEHKIVDVEDDNYEGLAWIPTCILNDVDKSNQLRDEDLRFSSKLWTCDKRRYRPRPPPPHEGKSPAAGRASLLPSQNSNNGLKPHLKHKNPMAGGGGGGDGGGGMQAIFLYSGKRSCGTGVFLPHITTGKDAGNTKKPAFAPVLLPARVVQVLNVNVHTLSAHEKLKDTDNNTKPDRYKSTKNNKISSHRISKIFLPKEWPY